MSDAPKAPAGASSGGVLSRVVLPTLLVVGYYAVFTPIGVVRRLFGKNALVRRPGQTAWISRPPGSRRGNLETQG